MVVELNINFLAKTYASCAEAKVKFLHLSFGLQKCYSAFAFFMQKHFLLEPLFCRWRLEKSCILSQAIKTELLFLNT
jgi:hypothetical protein